MYKAKQKNESSPIVEEVCTFLTVFVNGGDKLILGRGLEGEFVDTKLKVLT